MHADLGASSPTIQLASKIEAETAPQAAIVQTAPEAAIARMKYPKIGRRDLDLQFLSMGTSPEAAPICRDDRRKGSKRWKIGRRRGIQLPWRRRTRSTQPKLHSRCRKMSVLARASSGICSRSEGDRNPGQTGAAMRTQLPSRVLRGERGQGHMATRFKPLPDRHRAKIEIDVQGTAGVVRST